ncbi:hypothetical protein DZG00_08640 [Clavibacter lycopersici]|uniref:Uncharacterized protein n=1 Tax=Clavibacter lycopersici TaxID=2301718 RepID=A0A399T5A0_9MICO|nr:hypothetical protein [Clavibacter lycopersici]RIJ51496.1 hypothetical protein DZG00_08640 [Clavibacter lycopersici]RIJ61402.1 hypothetical protein DZG02_07205 [Clavibacter lycopersici]
MRRSPLVPAALLALVLLAGCAPGADDAGTLAAGDPPASSSSGEPVAVPTPAEVTGYDCNIRPVDPEAFEARVPLSSLGAEGAAAFAETTQGMEGHPGYPPEDGWFVLAASATDIEIMRAVTEPYEMGNGEIPPDHEYVAAKRVEEPGEAPRWMEWSASPCALRLDYAELDVATVSFEALPDPSSDRITFLVDEHACNSGEDAAGRVQLLALEETDDRVEVAFGVRPRNVGATCQGNPSTPFTVALSAPLGEREVVDTGLVIPRPVGLSPQVGMPTG